MQRIYGGSIQPSGSTGLRPATLGNRTHVHCVYDSLRVVLWTLSQVLQGVGVIGLISIRQLFFEASNLMFLQWPDRCAPQARYYNAKKAP